MIILSEWEQIFREYLFSNLDVPIPDNQSEASLIMQMGKILETTYFKTSDGIEINFKECERSFNLLKNAALFILKGSGMSTHSAIDLCYQIGIKKNSDYGSENIKKLGIIGIVVRLSDKISRLSNLYCRSDSVNYEKTSDTLIDIINYATYGEMLCNSAWP